MDQAGSRLTALKDHRLSAAAGVQCRPEESFNGIESAVAYLNIV
jgi:hypothetical protein